MSKRKQTDPRTEGSSPSAGSPEGGYFGPCKGTKLSAEEIEALANRTRVEVVWKGGNGPHIYEIRNDLDAWTLYRTYGATSTERLLADARFVALANEKLTDAGTQAPDSQLVKQRLDERDD